MWTPGSPVSGKSIDDFGPDTTGPTSPEDTSTDQYQHRHYHPRGVEAAANDDVAIIGMCVDSDLLTPETGFSKPPHILHTLQMLTPVISGLAARQAETTRPRSYGNFY
jgi:hypothetical protein